MKVQVPPQHNFTENNEQGLGIFTFNIKYVNHIMDLKSVNCIVLPLITSISLSLSLRFIA